ncbi:hypothetical protein ABTM71_19340, partial [Acinetobacter baumannii]
ALMNAENITDLKHIAERFWCELISLENDRIGHGKLTWLIDSLQNLRRQETPDTHDARLADFDDFWVEKIFTHLQKRIDSLSHYEAIKEHYHE